MNIFDELAWRGLVHQTSDEPGLREHLATPGRVLYCGFDPTADSLHIGNLVPLLALARFARAGHKPLFLLGGATGRIGDPSGKDKERQLKPAEVIEASAERIKAQAMASREPRGRSQMPMLMVTPTLVRSALALEHSMLLRRSLKTSRAWAWPPYTASSRAAAGRCWWKVRPVRGAGSMSICPCSPDRKRLRGPSS